MTEPVNRETFEAHTLAAPLSPLNAWGSPVNRAPAVSVEVKWTTGREEAAVEEVRTQAEAVVAQLVARIVARLTKGSGK